jgi:REP element-mobilizing transposase RayT
LLARVATFCGIQVYTYAILSNHFHLLVCVPPEDAEVTDTELIRRVRVLYGNDAAALLEDSLKNPKENAGLRDAYLGRMHQLPMFMKMLKHRFTVAYNRSTSGFGTVWSGKYRSILVENTPETLVKVAAYIDLNPVRAGLVKSPGTYRHSGFGEAVAGGKLARRGIGRCLGIPDHPWESARQRYESTLFGSGGLAPSQGSLSDALHKRIRGFIDGGAIGSAPFLQSVLAEHPGRFRNLSRIRAQELPSGSGEGFESLSTLRSPAFVQAKENRIPQDGAPQT